MSLKEEGYSIMNTTSGQEALSLFYSHNPDVIILDLGLPDMDGLDVISKIREISTKPIIVVSARLEEKEKIKALDLGANDYVVKPFYMGELLARIRVAIRMLEMNKETIDVYEKDYLKVDFLNRQVYIDQKSIHLTPIEFNLLKLLIENRGKVLTHNYIQKQIWGYEDYSNQNALRVFMATLRRKIEKKASEPKFILTEVGVGYRFTNE
jgi:two-component system KDP operon response regulator KdpE